MELAERLRDEPVHILAFPTNDFGQELANNEQIQEFLLQNFGYNAEHDEKDLPLTVFAESSLHNNEVYNLLRQHLPKEHVQHNFHKYLVNKDGIAVRMFRKTDDPMDLENEIRLLLQE